MNRSALMVVVACLGLASAISSTELKAQTSYVTDDFEIMFRAGPSVQNKIIRPLGSGTAIQVLEEDAGNGHSQIQTARGEIGYVLTRFISDAPPAKNQLSRLQERLDALTSDPSDVRSELAEAQEGNQILIEENMNLATRLQQAEERIAQIENLSGGVVGLTEENEKLNEEVQHLLLQLDDFRIQNETLRDTSDNKTRLVTLATICTGIFLGWILSLAGGRRRNRSSW